MQHSRSELLSVSPSETARVSAQIECPPGPLFSFACRAARVRRHGMSGVLSPQYDFQGQLTVELVLIRGIIKVDKAKQKSRHVDLLEQSKRQPQALQKIVGAMCGCFLPEHIRKTT
jgi:hypothetical protein